jgi:hypothetical protein
MDYTNSDANLIDPGTGQRMHQGTQPITTEVSSDDMNSLRWELMEVIKAAGLTPAPFDKTVPATYKQVSAAVAILAAATKSNYTAPGAGAVTTTIDGKLHELVSVTDRIAPSTNTSVVDCAAAMQAQDTFAAGVKTISFPAGQYLVSTNVTISSPCKFDAGAQLLIATGVTVTFSGYVTAGVYQIFAGAGAAVVTQSLNVWAEWWGQAVSPSAAYPYRPSVPPEVLRGADHEKFALSLAKTLAFTDTPNFRLNARAKAAFTKGAVRISIVGDSISAGADNWRSNSYTALLKTMLKQAFPWVSFVINNYAIGGMSAATLVSNSYVGAADRASFVLSTNYWFPPSGGGTNDNDTYAPTGYALLDEDYWAAGSVPGKTWKQQIVDSNPDIIVYAFGMNDGTDFDGFKTNYEAFQTFVSTALPANKPWFTLVSCFLPSKIPPGGQPHATWQVPAQCIADQVKYLAKRDGYGLIDANAVFNLLREGLRRDNVPYVHEANWRYAADASKWIWQGGFAYNAGLARGEGLGMAVRAIAARDIDFSATFQVTGFSGGYFVGRVMYRCANQTPGYLSGYSADIQLNSASNVAGIVVYYKSTQIASGSYDRGALPIVGTQVALKIKVYGDRHEIWANDVMVLDFDATDSLYAGALQVGVAQGAGYVMTPGLSYAAAYAETPTRVDKKWLLGTPIYDAGGTFQTYGDFISNLDSLGGNVVNHPTAWGHNTFYGLGIAKFVEALKTRVNAPLSVTKRSTTNFVVTAAAATPQVVSAIAAIVVKLRAATTVKVSMVIPYTLATPTSYPQVGVFVDGTWTAATLLPMNADFGLVCPSFSFELAAGSHTIQLGAVRSAGTETLTIGHSGAEYSISVQESEM